MPADCRTHVVRGVRARREPASVRFPASLDRLRAERLGWDRGVNSAVAESHGHLGEAHILNIHVRDRQAPRAQRLAEHILAVDARSVQRDLAAAQAARVAHLAAIVERLAHDEREGVLPGRRCPEGAADDLGLDAAREDVERGHADGDAGDLEVAGRRLR